MQRLRRNDAEAARARSHRLVERDKDLLRPRELRENAVPLDDEKRDEGEHEQICRDPEHHPRVKGQPPLAAGTPPEEPEGAEVVYDEEPDAAEDRLERHHEKRERIVEERREGAGPYVEAGVAEAHHRIVDAFIDVVQPHVERGGSGNLYREHGAHDPAYEAAQALHLLDAVCVHE